MSVYHSPKNLHTAQKLREIAHLISCIQCGMSSQDRSPPASPWALRPRTKPPTKPPPANKAARGTTGTSNKRKAPSKGPSDLLCKRKVSSAGAVESPCEEVVNSHSLSLAKKPPSYKTVVQLLASPLREDTRTVRSKNGESSLKRYLVYQCPNEFCKEKNRKIWFQKLMGFINPFNHLKTCIADGKVDHLYMVYEQNKESKRLHIAGTFFQPSVERLTAKELALHDYVRLIVLKNLPVSVVEDPEYRKFHRYNEVISKRLFKEVIFKMVDLVDKKLSEEMKRCGKGSILHDGWTCAGVHYIALFACYSLERQRLKQEKEEPDDDGVQLSLLSVSPMARTESVEDEKELEVFDETAVNFSSQTHAEHIRNVFRYYGVDVEDWAVCQTADNCSVNLKVAELLKIPHVACKNHILNLEVNEMVKNSRDLEGTINTIHETMSQCKKKLKNAALLRNLVNLVPVLHNKTRWSGKLYMMERFLRIRDDLAAVAEDDNSDLQMNRTVQFKNKVTRYCAYMKQINYSTKYMQTRKVTLAQCRDSLNMLMQDVEEGRNDRDSAMYRCSLGTKYIAEDANILRDPDFESGVCKIQNGMTDLMTDEEKTACGKLLLGGEEDSSDSDREGEVSYEERLRKRKRQRDNPSGYMNCDFILGSAAEVERLWSVASHVLTDERKNTSPLMLEALLFLQVNFWLWDMHTVKQAFHMSRNEKIDKKLQ